MNAQIDKGINYKFINMKCRNSDLNGEAYATFEVSSPKRFTRVYAEIKKIKSKQLKLIVMTGPHKVI